MRELAVYLVIFAVSAFAGSRACEVAWALCAPAYLDRDLVLVAGTPAEGWAWPPEARLRLDDYGREYELELTGEVSRDTGATVGFWLETGRLEEP